MEAATAKLPNSGPGCRHARGASATFAGIAVVVRTLSEGQQLKCDCPATRGQWSHSSQCLSAWPFIIRLSEDYFV